jgi:CRISPR-associated protein Cas5t
MVSKAVRLQLRQQMANYRKPASFLIKESFPLPPYSSVIGMVHNACGWTKQGDYHPMNVSIQGDYAGTVSDYATNYVFGIAFDPTRHQMRIDAGNGAYDGVNIGPKSYELLTDIELILHIIPEDQSLVCEIAEKLLYPPVYLSLGRYEDLVQIEIAEVVTLEQALDGMNAQHDIYIPMNALDKYENRNLIGTVYRLGKVFSIDKSSKKKPMRYWSETVLARHVCKKAFVSSDLMLVDQKYGDIVFAA